MTQHQDSLGLECGTRSAVTAGALHEVILLGDRGHLGAPYYPVLHGAEELIGLGLAVLGAAPGRRAKDALSIPGVQVQEDVFCELPVLAPQLPRVGPPDSMRVGSPILGTSVTAAGAGAG